jgi:hypothetical protein
MVGNFCYLVLSYSRYHRFLLNPKVAFLKKSLSIFNSRESNTNKKAERLNKIIPHSGTSIKL